MAKRTLTAEVVRSVAFGDITDTYSNLGSALSNALIMIIFKNTTEVTLFISEDGTNNHYELPSGNTEIYDFQTNSRSDDILAKSVGMQFEVKYDGAIAPTQGKVIMQGQYI